MSVRWFAWFLALVPVAAGIWSLQTGDGDFRSSGFMSGLGLTLGVVTLLLVASKPWKRFDGPWRWLSFSGVGLVGAVAVLAFVGGLPDFLEERGLSSSTDSYGPRAMLAIDGGFVVIGDDDKGAVIWYSEDGANWAQVPHVPLFDALEMRDAVAFDGGIVAVGQPSEDAEAVMLTSPDGRTWALESRFVYNESGISPEALSESDGYVVLVADTIGNDVAFLRGTAPSTLELVPPLPVFDDGEEVDDVACHGSTCIAVGKDLSTSSGLVWTSTAGEEWRPVAGDFAGVPLLGVAASSSGFVAAGADTLWRSSDGVEWERIDGSAFAGAAFDGVGATASGHIVFGRDLGTDAVVMWLIDGGAGWEKVIVDSSVSRGSAIRSIVNANGRWVAAGVNTDLRAAVVWTSTDGLTWGTFDVLERTAE